MSSYLREQSLLYESKMKRSRSDEATEQRVIEWRVFDRTISRLFEEGQAVFFRPKSSKERGRRGRLLAFDVAAKRWNVRFQNETERTISEKRLLPVYEAESLETKSKTMTILITCETELYRLLAASQLEKSDSVLEIGCSTGETSKIIWNYASKWVGFDNSESMVQKTRERIKTSSCIARCERVDALLDPATASDTVKGHQATSVVFIDIGGNREEAGVLLMLKWAMDTFPSVRMAVIKSKEVYNDLTLREKTSTGSSHGLVLDGNSWFRGRLVETARTFLPKHPLQAPKMCNPADKSQPICRYHNYYVDGCVKGKGCPYDHNHCHFCQQPGHTAKQCSEKNIL
jgi:SAM-dependent methyltransferase